MIKVKNLVKRYGDFTAVDHLTFEVKKGEVFGFLGPNGAGKTTTMRIISGFQPATSGSVEVAGFDVSKNPEKCKSKLGYLPETPPLYFELTVSDYLKFICKLKGVEKSERKESINWAIERCGLTQMQNRLIGNLSKGYKQRVGLAQAIVHKPPVLIFDEPTVGLDPKQIREIRELIKDLSGEHTIILSTHILPEVQMTCDRILIIKSGRLAAYGTIDEVAHNRSLEEVFIDIISKDVVETPERNESIVENPAEEGSAL